MAGTGQSNNPTGKGGFQEHPENRSDGGWKKEDSITYQYNFLLRMTPDELAEYVPITAAQKIAYSRVTAAMKENGLPDTKEITDRTEGKPVQQVKLGGDGEAPIALVRFFDDKDS